MVRKSGGRDGKMFEKVQGTVNYYVNEHKEIDKLAPSQLFTPHKRLSLQFAQSLFKGPGPKWRRLDSISQCAWRGRSLRLRCKAPSLPPES